MLELNATTTKEEYTRCGINIDYWWQNRAEIPTRHERCIERWCQTRIRGTGYSLTAYKSFRVQSFQSLVKRYSFVYREIISLSFSLSFSLSVSRFNLFNHVRASSCSDGSTKI